MLISTMNIEALIKKRTAAGDAASLTVEPAANGGFIATVFSRFGQFAYVKAEGSKLNWALKNLDTECERILAQV